VLGCFLIQYHILLAQFSFNLYRYKSLINARVPPKRNNKHKDFHFTSAQVSIVNEMATLCRWNTLTLSVDNKNKVDVEIPATGRRNKTTNILYGE